MADALRGVRADIGEELSKQSNKSFSLVDFFYPK
jgi:hypothetical protein